MGRATQRVLRLRFDIRRQVAHRPVVWRLVPAMNWLRVHRPHVLVGRRTQLIVDGFPSSGNSFSVAALQAAAGDAPVAVAHHLHCPGQVRQAVRMGIPVLLLIRDPREAVISLACRWPLSVEQGLRFYADYYESLLPDVDSMEVASFASVIADFGAVTDRLNERFGTAFPRFDHTPEHAGALFDPDDDKHRRRREQAALLRPELDDPALAPLLARAEAIHRRYGRMAAERHAVGGS